MKTLNVQSVRSSLIRLLNVTEKHSYPISERSEGLATMVITKALTDMAEADNKGIRLYAMSVATCVIWFLDTLEQPLDQAMASIDITRKKRALA
ncbi:hypothetical protein GCM10011502_22500 [Oceanisphaera marina]|uniref:Uncharacterized protein n=1 Tax=Oceanisphaera marina TaxID=2017550 RepID=A0ABQ1IQH3_9GAMM|nr:hypothetical protein GCM10011502_22500 [Oceanisphaera marina]